MGQVDQVPELSDGAATMAQGQPVVGCHSHSYQSTNTTLLSCSYPARLPQAGNGSCSCPGYLPLRLHLLSAMGRAPRKWSSSWGLQLTGQETPKGSPHCPARQSQHHKPFSSCRASSPSSHLNSQTNQHRNVSDWSKGFG